MTSKAPFVASPDVESPAVAMLETAMVAIKGVFTQKDGAERHFVLGPSNGVLNKSAVATA